MRYGILTCLFLLFSMTAAWSQQATTYVDSIYAYPSFETQWLEISARTAEDYLQHKLTVRKAVSSGRLLEGIETNGPKWSGHFLEVHVRGFRASVKYHSRHKYQVFRSHVNRDYRVQVTDSLGALVKDASVLLNDKKIRFKPRKLAYSDKQVFSKFLRVEVAGDTLLYPSMDNYYPSNWKKWYRAHASQFPLRPINRGIQWVGRPVSYLSRGLRHRGWRPYRYPGHRLVRRIRNPRPINGYALLSKPSFRYGDTLDISVYAARYGGRPFKTDALQFEIRSLKSHSRIGQLSLKQDNSGRYTARLPILSEDFPLDQDFRLVASPIGKRKRRVNINAKFKVADYYLNEFSLDISATDEVIPEKKTFIDVKAEDSNGLAIPDAEVEVVVALKDIARNHIDKVITYLLQIQGNSVQSRRYPTIGRNTFESAKVVNILLPIFQKHGQSFAPVRIVKTEHGREVELEQSPLKLSVDPDSLSQLSLKQTSGYPVTATVYQQYLSESDTLARANSSFEIQSALVGHKQRKTNLFKQGSKCTLEVEVEVKEEAQYVLIECPIPAGMEYLNRKEPRGPHAVHRAYARDRVAIFCDRLPVGTYTYRIALHPRFLGTYTHKGARIELQYAPHIDAKSSSSVVVIAP